MRAARPEARNIDGAQYYSWFSSFAQATASVRWLTPSLQ